jgi:hypothetical protein
MLNRVKIIVENNDCKIWRKDQVVIELMQAIAADADIIVSLNNEGPCAKSLELYDLLDKICNQTKYDRQRIQIQTCNLIEHHPAYQLLIRPPTKHILDLQKTVTSDPVKKITKHFGNFIGHSSRFRLAIASWLWKNYREKTLQTFHTTVTDELHREFVGLEDLWFHNYDDVHVSNAIDFLKNTPLKYDAVDRGPIMNMKMYGILDAYKNIFVDIVCNTYVTGNTFYMDEKLWRPIITKTPFIVHGSKNFIQNFRLLGFKTFDQWWDEGYSNDPPDVQALAILNIIDQISQYSIADIDQIYKEMQPVLDHNLQMFMKLTSSNFTTPNYRVTL